MIRAVKSTPQEATRLEARLVTHSLLRVCLLRQSIHKVLQLRSVLRANFRFERAGKRALEGALPATALVVQVRSPPGKFAGWVYLNSIRRADDTQHLPLGERLAATDAGALWNMLWALSGFVFHLCARTGLFPIIFALAAFVNLATHHRAEFFVKF